jgi:hypothetical protein
VQDLVGVEDGRSGEVLLLVNMKMTMRRRNTLHKRKDHRVQLSIEHTDKRSKESTRNHPGRGFVFITSFT